jgi:MobA/MobL family
MAVYFLRSEHVSRANGSRVTRAAAYRAGERIRDERTSEVYDHSDRRDVAYKEVVLPAELADRPDMGWARDRASLWNAAEHSGLRCNSRLAREWLVFLPPELNSEQRTQLVRNFAKELADKYKCAVDACVHLPRPGADPRNHHAHLLVTTREVTPDGLGPRTSLELGGRERHLLGLKGSSREEYIAIRERWAQLTNSALEHAGLDDRVDHRSFERQGINREPVATIPEKVFYAERKSQEHSPVGDAIRARHQERAEARLLGRDELARVVQKQKTELKERALESANLRQESSKQARWGTLTREERNERRRERYQSRRAIERQDSEGEAKRRAVKRQQYHSSRHQNPEATREAQRQWRRANAEEINRKQREYRKANAQELLSKRREYRASRAEKESLQKREYRLRRAEREKTQPATPTAEESAKRWHAYRESHGPGPTADESARNWLAYRELQKNSGASQETMHGIDGGKQQSASNDDDESDRKLKRQRTHDHDFEL